MSSSLNVHEITNACRILFGPGVKITSEFLRALNHADLKESYRKKAMEYHPDRSGLTGGEASDMNELLKNVNLAYEHLSRHILDNSHSPLPSPPHKVKKAISSMNGSGNGFWDGPVPDCELFIGQYLFYSGLVSWSDFVGAVAWQRSQRPTFGGIARMWNYLTDDDSERIAASISSGERIGDSALRQGYLTAYQCNAVLQFQRWLQTPIGQYFTERGILAEEEINQRVKALNKHNARIQSSKPKK